MGIADRDYMREPPPPQSSRGASPLLLAAAAVALLVLGVHLARAHGPVGRHWGVVVQPLVLPHTPGITVAVPQSPYAANDPWRAWLAPESVCPGGDDASAPPAAQVATATCLLNYARARQGLTALPLSGVLNSAAALKAQDIVACRDFSHTACGKAADADARGLGLTDRMFGENIYWGPEVFQPPRVAVDQWLNSEHHRENLFNPQWTEQGVAVLAAPGFRGAGHSEVWVNEFGTP